MSKAPAHSSSSFADLPDDELFTYARSLGLDVETGAPRGELLRCIRERHELLLELDQEALLDVAVWARLPVRQSASKEALSRLISGVFPRRLHELSERGLHALARLRGIPCLPTDNRESIEQQLRRQEGLLSRLRRARQSAIASIVSRIVEGRPPKGEYRFLPEKSHESSLREHIGEAGVVGGIAQKLRGVADQYIAEKLDEIERRIDQKLDEIDERLAEWRDREISNRLRIIKITLVAAIVVAILSLGYDYLKARAIREDGQPARVVTETP